MGYIKRRITETLPTVLEPGEEIYYQDANGNLTLWVGHADGSAWPSVGYKEYRVKVSQDSTSAPVLVTLRNDFNATYTPSFVDTGEFEITASSAVFDDTDYSVQNLNASLLPSVSWVGGAVSGAVIGIFNYANGSLANGCQCIISVRAYPS